MYELNIFPSNEETNYICPQVAHMGRNYRWDDLDSLTHIRVNQPLAVRPNLHAFHLDDETHLTDIVSQGYIYTMGLLVSKHLYGVLLHAMIQQHEIYGAVVVHRGATHQYVWVHMIEDVAARLDFSRSEFAVRYEQGFEETATIDSMADLDRARLILTDRGRGVLFPRRMEFGRGTPPYDLFCLALTGSRFFISRGLADELTRRRLTGFELVPTQAKVSFGGVFEP
jgi:hypothetical protein